MQALIQPAFAQINQRQFEDVADNLLPPVKTVQDQMQQHGWVTTAMSHISDEAVYHASPWYQNFRKQIDCDDNVLSIRVVDFPASRVDQHRPAARAAPFCAREVALLKLLHDEMRPSSVYG